MNIKVYFSMYKNRTTVSLGIITGWWLLHIIPCTNMVAQMHPSTITRALIPISTAYRCSLYHLSIYNVTALNVKRFVVMCHPNIYWTPLVFHSVLKKHKAVYLSLCSNSEYAFYIKRQRRMIKLIVHNNIIINTALLQILFLLVFRNSISLHL